MSQVSRASPRLPAASMLNSHAGAGSHPAAAITHTIEIFLGSINEKLWEDGVLDAIVSEV